VEFVSTGYSDPEYIGGHGTGYPPEGDDERTIERATLDGKVVDEALLPEIAGHLCEDMAEVEIDPDYWRDNY